MRGMKLGTTEEERDIGIKVTRNIKPSVQCSKTVQGATVVLGQINATFTIVISTPS